MEPAFDAKSEKPCRTCTDFKTWSSLNSKKISSADLMETEEKPKSTSHIECPVDKDELGRSTWNLLHTIAAFYPDEPTDRDKTRVKELFTTVSQSYPCEVCAEDFQKQLERFPPKTNSQNELTQWLCRAHNRINLKTGKPLFDCTRVNERWRDGWKDGSCD